MELGRVLFGSNDLYSIAATVYHLATGKPPISGTHMQIYVNHTKGEKPDFQIPGRSGSAVVSLQDAAPVLAKVLAKLLSKDRGSRVLGEHNESPDDAEIREIYNEWINALGEHCSFDAEDLARGAPGLLLGVSLPDSTETPDGDVIGSRITRAQL